MRFARLPETFADAFLDRLRECSLVGIHGPIWSGKSHLADDLVAAVGGVHIDVGDHLSIPSNGRSYLEQVKIHEVIQCIQSSIKPVFLDSFVVLDVLEKGEIKADFLIFCERIVGDSSIRFNQKSEQEFASYQSRRNPRLGSKAIFTSTFLFS